MTHAITITNTFHERSCSIKALGLPHSLTESQTRKVNALCGRRDCKCHQHMVQVDGKRAGYEVGAGVGGRWQIVQRQSGPGLRSGLSPGPAVNRRTGRRNIIYRGRVYEEISRKTVDELAAVDPQAAAAYREKGIEGEVVFRKPGSCSPSHLATFWQEGGVEKYYLID